MLFGGLKRHRMNNQYFVSYYFNLMKSRGFSKRIIKDRSEVLRLQSIIFKTIKEHYVENEGGVYIDNIGYLCHVIRPNRRFFVNKVAKDVIRFKTDGFKYNHIVLDLFGRKKYFYLYMSDSLKLFIGKRMKKGLRYRFLYREIMTICHRKKGKMVHKFVKGIGK